MECEESRDVLGRWAALTWTSCAQPVRQHNQAHEEKHVHTDLLTDPSPSGGVDSSEGVTESEFSSWNILARASA
jgi:hypothetical protein